MSTLLAPTTELEAVNRLLGSIGQTPVNTLEFSGIPDVTDAVSYLREALKDVEAVGWSWNTDRSYTLNPDPSGYIAIPTGALEVDPEDPSASVVIRRNPATGQLSLYDYEEQSFKFDDSVDATIVWAFPFEDIPQAARTYVTILAGRRFQAQNVTSNVLSRFQEEDEMRAFMALQRIERRTRDANAFRSNREGARMLRRRF